MIWYFEFIIGIYILIIDKILRSFLYILLILSVKYLHKLVSKYFN